MKHEIFSLAVLAAILPACGSTSGKTDPGTSTGQTEEDVFKPPPPLEGYTRLVSPTVKGVLPGSDMTFCQYVMAPLDHDVDVLDVRGYQSKFGHHAVAFASTSTQEVGSSMPCMGEGIDLSADAGIPTASAGGGDLSMGAFLGGTGGEAGGGAAALPPGVAFRLTKGSGIMFNVHFLNTGGTTIDGDAVLDFEFADADPNRKIAAMFLNLNFGFTVAPAVHTDSTVECTAKSEVKLIMMSNHMHDFGASASTEVTRADGTVVNLHDDAKWTYDMQFNPVYSKWPVEDPFVLRAGDTIRTRCSWENTTSNSMTFPREMCIGVGFALTDGAKPTTPACVNGTWFSP